MPTNIEVPALGESITEAVLLRWLKDDGAYVEADEPLAELETDKANVDIPASAAGILRQGKPAGQTVKVGESIARIEEAPGGKPAPAAKANVVAVPPAPKPQASTQTQPQTQTQDLRPSVRRMVEESGVNPAGMAPTGPGGRLIKEDVARHLAEREQKAGNGKSAIPPAPPAPPPPAPPAPAPRVAPAPPAPGTFDANGIKRVPMSKIR
jgi:2-oxoglutarate dehydrogenase E2 component (dihydrolipoamide succinyltransferase)